MQNNCYLLKGSPESCNSRLTTTVDLAERHCVILSWCISKVFFVSSISKVFFVSSISKLFCVTLYPGTLLKLGQPGTGSGSFCIFSKWSAIATAFQISFAAILRLQKENFYSNWLFIFPHSWTFFTLPFSWLSIITLPEMTAVWYLREVELASSVTNQVTHIDIVPGSWAVEGQENSLAEEQVRSWPAEGQVNMLNWGTSKDCELRGETETRQKMSCDSGRVL